MSAPITIDELTSHAVTRRGLIQTTLAAGVLFISLVWRQQSAKGISVPVGIDLLSRVLLSAPELPGAGPTLSGWHVIFPPGSSVQWTETTGDYREVDVIHVLEGTFSARSDGPARLLRASGQTQLISSADNVALFPADVFVILHSELAQSRRNIGLTAGREMTTNIFTADEPFDQMIALSPDIHIERCGGLTRKLWHCMPQGDLSLAYRLLLFPAGVSISCTDPDPVLRFMEAGAVERWRQPPDGSESEHTRFSQSDCLPVECLDAPVTWTLANDDDDPATVLEFRFEPDGSAGGARLGEVIATAPAPSSRGKWDDALHPSC